MLEAYISMVLAGYAVVALVIGGAMLVDTVIDIWETKTGKTLESVLGLEEELD